MDDLVQIIWDEDGRILLEIIPCYDAAVLDLLPVDVEKVNWQGRQAMEATRQRQISQRYPRLKQPTGVLVLLPDYRSTLRNRDPKKAIRAGFTQARRISKFYTPRKEKESPEGLTHRLENSVMALLKIMGYRYNPYYMPPPDTYLPPQLDLMVFWLFQRNARHCRDQKVLFAADGCCSSRQPSNRGLFAEFNRNGSTLSIVVAGADRCIDTGNGF
ncbi:hypothetical protein HC776_00995 [bacterium]|nr:hypothetical protein [bacterium]